MWIRAFITTPDLENAFAQLLPARIGLSEDDADRFLWLDKPSVVECTSSGVRIDTNAKLQWEVIGVKVPIVLRSVTVRLTPRIARRDGHDVLVFRAQLDDADLSSVPEFVESTLTTRVNEALAQDTAQLVWDYADTLDFHFKLPARVEPKRVAHWFATDGELEMNDRGLVVSSRFELIGELARDPNA